MIEKYLTEERVRINIHAEDWHDLTKVIGKIMLEAGDIEESYITAMADVVEEMGPYAVIAPGVVLLHAQPERGVKRICLAMATLEEGVNFGSVNDPVRLAIGLGALDHEGHIELLRELSTFLQDKERVKKILLVKNKKEFIDLVRNKQTGS